MDDGDGKGKCPTAHTGIFAKSRNKVSVYLFGKTL